MDGSTKRHGYKIDRFYDESYIRRQVVIVKTSSCNNKNQNVVQLTQNVN